MSDNVRSTWRMDDDRKKRWRITDDALSKTIATKLEMRLDRKVHHQLVLVSSGYLPQMTTVQFRKLMNNSEKLLIQAMQAELKEGMSVQLSFMMPSLELEVTEAKKKAFKAKYKGKKKYPASEASVVQSLIAGARSGRFMQDQRSALPVRANLIRSLQEFERDGRRLRLTLNHELHEGQNLMPLTRARAFLQTLQCVKDESVAMLPSIFVCIPEDAVRTALVQMIEDQQGDREFWDRVRIFEANKLAGGVVQQSLLDKMKHFHTTKGAKVTISKDMAERRESVEHTTKKAFEPLEGVVGKELYLQPPLPDLSGSLLAVNIDTNAIISVAKPRIGNKSKEVLKPEDRPGYFENRFLPALIAEIEGLAALTGTRAIVFLSRTAQMETLHAWERVLIGKSGSDAITPEDHNRLDAAGEQGDPNREPGYARKAMRELVTKLKASPSVEYHEETRDHGMVSLAAKDDALGREQVAVQLLSLRAIYLDVLQAMDTEIERDGESERELLDQIDVAVDLLDAGDELADKDIATLKQTIRQIASAMPNHPQDDLLALVASLQIGHTLEEAPLSCDSTIIYEFLDLVKSKEGAKESAGRNIAAVCLTADQLAAHLWSQADPTKIAAVPLEQGKYDFALADNVARAATGGRVYSDVFLFDDIENPDENVLLNDKDVEKPDGPVREAMRLCLRSLVAVSLAHLVDHDKASVGEEPQPETA